MIVYDEAKCQANLANHGLDLADAGLGYDAPNKITLCFASPGKKPIDGRGDGRDRGYRASARLR